MTRLKRTPEASRLRHRTRELKANAQRLNALQARLQQELAAGQLGRAANTERSIDITLQRLRTITKVL